MKKIRLYSILMVTGVIGLFINLVLNFYAYFYADKVTASPFEEAWWSIWLPSYLVWMSFITIASFIGVNRKD